MKKTLLAVASLSLFFGVALHAQAGLISVQGTGQILTTAPVSVLNNAAFHNTLMQGFDEQQGYHLTGNLAVDGGVISGGNGLFIDSHMIFLNTQGNLLLDATAQWTFDGNILGVMSDNNGVNEGASSSFLGATGTQYPVAFNNRGFESNNPDTYSYLNNVLDTRMFVIEPGDWIRVITEHNPVPEPGTMILFGAGLAGLAGFNRRKK